MGEDRWILRRGRVVGAETPVDIVLDGPVIEAIGTAPTPTRRRTVDLDGRLVAPGYVDAQINGGFGADFTADPESIWQVGDELRAFGVTAFLPTLVSTDFETIRRARHIVVAGPPTGYRGASVWGLHVEGPFLAPGRRGAHDATKLCAPAPELVADWSPDDGVAMVTLAPELPGALPTIRSLVARGVVVSLGHSEADHAAAAAGFDAGARAVTHLYNAMSAGDHRNPGLAPAALADPRITAGLIVDNVHLHPTTTQAAWSALGPTRTMLVTDAIAAVGLVGNEGGGRLGTQAVIVAGDAPRLAGGVLAGSLLTLDAAVRNLRGATGCSRKDAVATVTTVPAGLFGLSRRIAPGEPADLTILDEDLNVVGTVVGGHLDERLVAHNA